LSDKKGNTSAYMSIGTIRVRIDIVSGSIKTVFFTPRNDFSVSYNDEKFAALLPKPKKECAATEEGTPKKTAQRKLAPYKSEQGIPLNLDLKCADLVKSAIEQCAVEIEVEDKCENCSHEDCKDKDCKGMEWSLLAITIPAASQMK